jgi:hypothetical protein
MIYLVWLLKPVAILNVLPCSHRDILCLRRGTSSFRNVFKSLYTIVLLSGAAQCMLLIHSCLTQTKLKQVKEMVPVGHHHYNSRPSPRNSPQGHIQVVSKRALQWCSKCYCVASFTKTFTRKGVQTIHRSRC